MWATRDWNAPPCRFGGGPETAAALSRGLPVGGRGRELSHSRVCLRAEERWRLLWESSARQDQQKNEWTPDLTSDIGFHDFHPRAWAAASSAIMRADGSRSREGFEGDSGENRERCRWNGRRRVVDQRLTAVWLSCRACRPPFLLIASSTGDQAVNRESAGPPSGCSRGCPIDRQLVRAERSDRGRAARGSAARVAMISGRRA